MAKKGKLSKGPKAGAANRGQKKGQGALRPGSALKHSNASAKPGRTGPKGETRVRKQGSHLRSEGTIKRLQLYNSKPDLKRRKEQALKPVRIQPDRRWFGNTRVLAQDKLQSFRETIAKGVEDPFAVVLKSSKLPMSLLRETEAKASRMDLLSVSPFQEVFSKRRQQKRAKIGATDLEGFLEAANKKAEGYNNGSDRRALVDAAGQERAEEAEGHVGEEIFNKGTSRRIWAELYKVVDAADVLVFVLDARDPMGTRCQQLERELRKSRQHKHIVLLVNKVDLVPTWVTRRWVQELTKDFPTLAFHASITNPFGKNALLNLLRQFGNLLKEKKHVTVGMIGYPNVGKSSVINALKRKKVCKAAPVPGETRVWQYIALTKKIYLLDCPGIVPPSQSDFAADCAKVLKGVVRAERLKTPSDYIHEVLGRVKKAYLLQRYRLPLDTTWRDSEEFLTLLGKKMGKLVKGGEADIDTAARIVLYDWQRGRIPYFTAPPEAPTEGTEEPSTAQETGEKGEEIAGQSLAALGEIPCAHAFDDEDRRGEEPAASCAAGSAGSAGSAEEPSATKPPVAQKRAGTQVSSKLRKRRKAKGGTGRCNREADAHAAPLPGTADWKAVVAEFG
ncbi:Gnl2 [Symbiodinium pilosum]|uniref:Nucleolar GTP-binding protein 2 n=1 Tax=Symbiodinium pilosum TaxID=2952 RepID=A0A812LG15_SYMPI|nr:Gnl2 [Symbiodinium pilosum]